MDCSDDDLLATRINKRILEMVDRGLEKEVTDFYMRFVNEVNNGERGAVPNVGLFQAIGFKVRPFFPPSPPPAPNLTPPLLSALPNTGIRPLPQWHM